MITGDEFAKYFSDNEYNNDEERLYSTGNEDLDYLLEKAFSDGYVYAQKEFGKFQDWAKKTGGITDVNEARLLLPGPEKKSMLNKELLKKLGKGAAIVIPTAAIGTYAYKKYKNKKSN